MKKRLFFCLFVLFPIITFSQFVVTRSDGNEKDLPLQGSLAQAILDINQSADSGPYTITFNLQSDDLPVVIRVKDPEVLNVKKSNVLIDGTSQPGWTCDPIVRIVGPGFGRGFILKNVRNCHIKGFQTDGFESSVTIDSGGNHKITGNWFGTDSTGNYIGKENGKTDAAVKIFNNSDYNQIGSKERCDRNVIGGHQIGILVRGNYNTIQNNFIGVSQNGVQSINNNYIGIDLHGKHAMIGGELPGEKNVVSNTSFINIAVGFSSGQPQAEDLWSDSCSIINNYIGLDSTGNSLTPYLTSSFTNRYAALVSQSDNIIIKGNKIAGNYSLAYIFINETSRPSNGSILSIRDNYLGTFANGSGIRCDTCFLAGRGIHGYVGFKKLYITNNIICNSGVGIEFYGDPQLNPNIFAYNNRIGIDKFDNPSPNNIGIQGPILVGGIDKGNKIAFNRQYGLHGYCLFRNNEIFCNKISGASLPGYSFIDPLSNSEEIFGTCLFPNSWIHIYEIDSCNTCGSLTAQGQFLIDSIQADTSGNWHLRFSSPKAKSVVVTETSYRSIAYTTGFSPCYDLTRTRKPKISMAGKADEDSVVMDFGSTDVYSQVQKIFYLKNTGNAVLHLSAKGSYLNRFKSWNSSYIIIAPGDSVAMEFRMDTGNAGEFEETLIYNTNVESQKQVKIILRGRVHDVSSLTASGLTSGKIKVVPNPFIEKAQLVYEGDNIMSDDLSLSVYNLQGQEVYRKDKIDLNSIELERGRLLPQLYFYQVSNGREINFRGQFMIE